MLLLLHHLAHRHRARAPGERGSGLAFVLACLVLFFACAVLSPFYVWNALRALFGPELFVRCGFYGCYLIAGLGTLMLTGIGGLVWYTFFTGLTALGVYESARR